MKISELIEKYGDVELNKDIEEALEGVTKEILSE